MDSGVPLGTVKGVGNQRSWHLLSPLIPLWCCLLLAGGKNVALHQQLLSLEFIWKQQGHRFQLSPTKQVLPRKNLLLTLAFEERQCDEVEGIRALEEPDLSCHLESPTYQLSGLGFVT